MEDTKYLRLRGNVWSFQKQLSAGQLYTRSLKTDSLTLARRMRDEILVELEKATSNQYTPKALRNLVAEIKAEMNAFYASNDDEAHYLGDIEDVLETEERGDLLRADALLIADGSNTSAPNTHLRMDYTLEEDSESFLQLLVESNKDETTINAYKRGIKNFLTFKNSKFTYLSDITRGDVTRFIEFLAKEKNLSIKSINNQLGGLCGSYQYALDRDHLASSSQNPFKGHSIKNIFPKKINDDKNEPIDIDDFRKIQTFLNNSNRFTNGRKWSLAIALVSGMRLAEQMGLLKEDIKMVNNIWCFDVKPNVFRTLKNANAKRLIPIHSSILNAVLELKNISTNQFLFEESLNNKRIGATLGAWYSKTKKDLGLKPSHTFHGLRRKMATALENANVEEGIAATIMGHSKTTLTYGLYSDGHTLSTLKDAVESITPYYADFIELFPKD